jgi:hypothetical protein
MPRYHFHIRDGQSFIPDEEGMEFEDLECAKAEARESCKELAIQRVRNSLTIDGLSMEIVDESGTVLDTLHCKDNFS